MTKGIWKQTLYHWVTPLARFEWPGTLMRQAMWQVVHLLICLCFFMSDLMKALNPFLVRLPREQHEQYLTDIMRELKKLGGTEKNTDDDDVVARVKYGLIFAFAKKIWTPRPSIGFYVKIEPNSEVRLATINPKTNANTSHKIARTFLAWKKQPTCINQIMYWIIRDSLYVYFLLQIIIHIQVVTETL